VGRFTRQQTFLLALLFTLGLLVAPRSVAWALDAPARDRSFLATAPDTSVAITLTEFTITPASITVPLGEPVTFVVTNAGGAQHNLVVELESRGIEQRLFATNLLPGETRRVTFTFDASGNWEMYCPVGNHRALGMQGTIQVAERTTPTPAPTASTDALTPSSHGHTRSDRCPNGRVIAEPDSRPRHDADTGEHATRHPTIPGHATLWAAAGRQLRDSRCTRSRTPDWRPAADRSAPGQALRHDVRVTRNSYSPDASLVPVRPTQRARPRSHLESGHGPESGTHRVPSQRHTVEE
jgi:plastocyanin